MPDVGAIKIPAAKAQTARSAKIVNLNEQNLAIWS
jgi:hypothetical protein